MAAPAGAAAANALVKAAGAIGRVALRAVAGQLRQRVAGVAFSNLRVLVAVLATGMAFTTAIVTLPVMMIVFALSVGVSHGLPIADTSGLPPGPPLAAGELLCPVRGAVTTQPFGPSVLFGEPALFGHAHFHAGVDLAVAGGTPIHAAESGQVLQAAGQTNSVGLLIGYGNLVRIGADSGRVDFYGHMSGFAVNRGDVVQQGQVIGYVGTTGYSTGPHVHFEVRENNVPVDPAPFMQPCSTG